MTTTSGGALLLEAVVPQLAVVLLSLPLKSCGWDLTDVSSARVTAKSSRRPPRGSSAGKAFELFDALASGVVKHRHVAVFEGEVAALFLMTCNKNQLSLLGSMCQLLRQQLSIPTSPLSLEPLLSAGVWVAGVARIHHPHLLIIFGVDLMLGRDSTLTLFLGTSAEPMRACL